MTHRKFGRGTISLLLTLVGIRFGFNLWGVCIGDEILNFIGLKAWSNDNTGIHYTVYYSLIFFLPAFLLGMKYKGDFGATVGKIISATIGIILVLSTLFLFQYKDIAWIAQSR